MATGTMHVLDSTGHTAVEWNTDDAATIAAAEREFQAHLGTGGAVISTDPDIGQVRTFDPAAREMIAIPQIQGG